MKQIAALVSSAAGINEERGDKIEVVNVRFAKAAADVGSKAPSAFAFDKNDIMRGAEILAMTLVAAALLFFVARPLVKGVFDAPGAGSAVTPMGLPGQAMGMAGAGSVAALPGGEASTGDERVDIARIQGSVNANAMKQVSQMVTENPEQTVSVIRAWLQERR